MYIVVPCKARKHPAQVPLGRLREVGPGGEEEA